MFDQEQARAYRVHDRQEGLASTRGELGVAVLHAEDAGPSRQRDVLYLEAAVVALVGERGGDLVAFELVVLIVGMVGTKTDMRDARHGVGEFTTQVYPLAFQVDPGRMPLIVPMVVIVVGAAAVAATVQVAAMGMAAFVLMVVTWKPVLVFAIGVGQADVSVVGHPGQADTAVLRFRKRIGNAQGPLPGCAIVVAIDRGAFGMQHPVVAQLRGDRRAECLFLGHAVAADHHLAFGLGHRQCRRDLVVKYVDHATNRAAAKAQGGWTTQHFDARTEQRIHGNGVVRRHIGGIDQRWNYPTTP